MKKLLELPPVRFALELWDVYGRCGGPQSAAALAYFLILTLFPLLLCVNCFIGLFHLNLEQFLLGLDRLLPREGLGVMRDFLSYASRTYAPAVLPAALAAIVFSASAGLRTLFHALEEISGRRPRVDIGRFLMSIALSLVFLAGIYLSIIVIFTGEWFFHLLEVHLPQALLAALPLSALSQLWLWLKYLLLFCAMLLIVLALYWEGLPKKQRGWGMIFAAAFAAAALVGCSALFGWFIGLSSRYSLLYGSLASLIILLVWLYLCGNILLLGAAAWQVLWGRRHKA